MFRTDVGPLTSVPEIRYINQHRVHPFPRVARFLEHAPRNLELYTYTHIYIYLLIRPVSRLYGGSRENTWKTCRHPTWLEIGTSALRLFRDRITDQFPVRARDEECSVRARFRRALLRSPLKGSGRSREGARTIRCAKCFTCSAAEGETWHATNVTCPLYDLLRFLHRFSWLQLRRCASCAGHRTETSRRHYPRSRHMARTLRFSLPRGIHAGIRLSFSPALAVHLPCTG